MKSKTWISIRIQLSIQIASWTAMQLQFEYIVVDFI